MTDLVSRLSEAIEEAERRGRFGAPPVGYFACDKTYLPSEVHTVYVEDALTERGAVHRRCSADREIVALYQGTAAWTESISSYNNAMDRGYREALAEVLRVLAGGYGIEVEP